MPTAATVIFVCAGIFIAYVLFGYPILLSVWARLSNRPIRKRFVPTPLSVIIPVRNGAPWIEAKIRSLLDSDYPADLLNVLVVSDGSTDGTNEVVEKYPDSRVRLLALTSGGKAVAVTRGLEEVATEIIVLTDVRQTFDRHALRRLVACFADPSVGVVTGELIIREGANSEEYNTGLYWRYEKWIRRNLNRIDAMLGATGSIYAVRRDLARPIPSDILLDDVYLPFKAAFRGSRIYLEEGAKAYDVPTSLQTEFWRKLRTQAGVYQILKHFPSLLWPGQRRFVHWTSHKLGRLLLPFAMLAAGVATFWLPGMWRPVFLAVQALFYGLALIDFLIPEHSPLKRFSAVTRTFTTLVVAAFCAIAVIFFPATHLWKETRVSVAHPERLPQT
ncbi:MAG: glycosyltransferase family 2 protein [Acidobacteriaceae bacterium]|nr:glycosyltransferase family 2 protein [Acidobacteriaceae bacterium]